MSHWRGRLRLHRQLFLSFGLAIIIAMGISAWVASALPTSLSGRPFGRFMMYLASGAILWGISGMWARRLSRPLRELSRTARELGQGNLKSRVRLPRHGGSEVHELAHTFNEMAERLEALVESKNDLLHAVSHELRTPLTRLRVLLGILSEKNLDPKLARALEREVLEMDMLVGELLAGARIDAGALQKRQLDVEETVRTCLMRSELAEDQGVVDPGARRAQADPTLLARALLVLLDNAKKHGRAPIRLRACAEPGRVRFEVQDAGPGFVPADLPTLFTPFTRGRGEAPDDQRGLGLGLYLVRRIAEAHGGQAFARNAPQGGAVAGFWLPHRALATG